jgi:hypothetical protein
VVVRTCNPNNPETEQEDWVQGQLGLHRKILSQKKKEKKKEKGKI